MTIVRLNARRDVSGVSMNHIEFIEKNVREELLRQGSASSGSGGIPGGRYVTSGCHRQSRKGECLTMLCDTQSYGQRSRPAQLNAGKQSAKREKGGDQAGLF